jgi:hypothetical protein
VEPPGRVTEHESRCRNQEESDVDEGEPVEQSGPDERNIGE